MKKERVLSMARQLPRRKSETAFLAGSGLVSGSLIEPIITDSLPEPKFFLGRVLVGGALLVIGAIGVTIKEKSKL